MNKKQLLRGTIVLLAVLMTSPGWADRPGGEASSSPSDTAVLQELEHLGEPPPSSAQQETRRHFEAKKRERLIQMLQLDEATRAKLLQRLEQLDQKGEELHRQRREAFLALREQAKGIRSRGGRKPRDADKPAAGSAVDEGALKSALDRIYAVEEAMTGLRRERWQVGRDLLTAEQQVKFLMYSVKFHKEMRERLAREHEVETGRRQQSGQEREKP
ncbi:MAG TPA: hypothetical protein VGJ57_12495 [Nitrospirales bacterium]|jgi:hypothetical protein